MADLVGLFPEDTLAPVDHSRKRKNDRILFSWNFCLCTYVVGSETSHDHLIHSHADDSAVAAGVDGVLSVGDRVCDIAKNLTLGNLGAQINLAEQNAAVVCPDPVSYTHLRAHETDSYLVCRLLLEK